MKSRFDLSGNTLKLIATLSMLLDHIGYILFPQVKILRILGRLSFPIFAFMISEGCIHTKNKKKYLLTIFSVAFLCQIIYFLFADSLYMCILVTFSLSILMIYALQNFKKALSEKKGQFLTGCIFVFAIIIVYFLNQHLTIDYGFWGCIAPVFASLFGDSTSDIHKRVLLFGIALAVLAVTMGGNMLYSLLAIPLLLLYSGKRGRLKLKYFFYIFYPVHLAVLQGIAALCEYIS